MAVLAVHLVSIHSRRPTIIFQPTQQRGFLLRLIARYYQVSDKGYERAAENWALGAMDKSQTYLWTS